MYQDSPGAAHYRGAHSCCQLKVDKIPLSIGSLHAEDRLPSPCHGQEPLLQSFSMGHGQAQH
jgi:hypothetical protein